MEGIYFFGEYQRWNLGWNNPNQAGVFVAMWIPWLWGMQQSISGRRYDFVVCGLLLAVELGLWFLVCKTYSRGALVAVVASGLVFFVWRHVKIHEARKWNWWAARVAGIVILLMATGFFSRIDPRFVSQDASAGNRLTLWKGGLQMISVSPWQGWGKGNSGPAFMHWFQAPDATEAYAGMVNSYLHVGVERGLPFLAMVILLATVLLLMAWHASRASSARAGGFAAAAGCSWLVFLVANGFSTLWIFGNLWWLPGFAGIWIVAPAWVVNRNFLRIRISKILGVSCVFSIAVVLMVWVAGYGFAREFNIAPSSCKCWISCSGIGGVGPKREVLLFPDASVLGDTWGKEVRRLAGEVKDLRLWIPEERQTTNFPAELLSPPQWIIACGSEAEHGFNALLKNPEASLILVHPLGRPVVPEGGNERVHVLLPMLDTRGTGRQWRVVSKKRGWECRTSPGVGQDVRLVWPGVLVGSM